MSRDNREQIKALEETLRICQEKRAACMRESVITASVIIKFELKERIKECEQEIIRITAEIKSLENNQPEIAEKSFTSTHKSNNSLSNQSKEILNTDNQKSQMNKITWLHLSDWHQTGKDIHRRIVRDKLIEDIENRQAINPDLANIDFIVFSGDLAHSANPQEYKAAQKYFLEPILKATNLSPDKIFFVPGNHDFDRNEIEFLPPKIQNPFENENDVREWLNHERKKNYILEPFKAYREFINSFNQQNSPEYASIKKLTINNNTIGLLGINSALMAARNKDSNGRIADRKYLIVGESQVYDPLESIKDCQIKIAVLHHPFNWLAEFDSKRIKSRLGRGCHFILCGHEHLPEVDIKNSTTNGNHVIIPAGASYEQLDYPNSYNFVHLNLERNSGDVYLRKWSRERDEFIKHEEASRNGQFSITSLPKQLGQLSNSNNSSKVEFTQETRRTETVISEKPRSLDIVMKEVLSRKNSPEEKRDTTVTFLRYLIEQPEINDEKASSILNTAIDQINNNDGRTIQPNTEMDKAFHKVLHSPRFAKLCKDRLLQGYINFNGEHRKAIGGIIFFKLEIDSQDINAENTDQILYRPLKDLTDISLNDQLRVQAGLKLVETFFQLQVYNLDVKVDFLNALVPTIIKVLISVLEREILTPGDSAVSNTAIWALGWLTNAKTCHSYKTSSFTPQQLDILRKIVQDNKQDPFTRSWSALILSVCIPENPTFAQADWIYEWAVVADGGKPHKQLPTRQVVDSTGDIEHAIQAVRKLLASTDIPVRARKSAVIALGRLGYFDLEMVEPLLQVFKNEIFTLIERDEALVYLVFIYNEKIISELISGIKRKKNNSDYYGFSNQCLLALIATGDIYAISQQLEQSKENQIDPNALAYVLAGVANPMGQRLLESIQAHNPAQEIRNAALNAFAKSREWSSSNT